MVWNLWQYLFWYCWHRLFVMETIVLTQKYVKQKMRKSNKSYSYPMIQNLSLYPPIISIYTGLSENMLPMATPKYAG